MHCFCRKIIVFSFSFVCFCEKVPRFVKLELTLNKIPVWHGLKYQQRILYPGNVGEGRTCIS